MAKQEKNKKGYVYILTNEAFYQYIKIGWTEDLKARLANLNSNSGIPKSFHVYAYYETENKLSDIIVHNLIDTINPDLRVKDSNHAKWRREFFEMTPEKAYKILESMAKFAGAADSLHYIGPNGSDDDFSSNEIATSNQKTTEGEKRHQSENFSFKKCRIEPGSVITYYKDKSITATVLDDSRVIYNGKEQSLSAATKEIRNNNQSVQGPAKWCYEGELLTKRRKRLEEEDLYK